MTLKGQVNGVEWAMVITVKQPGISRLKQGQKRGQLINSHTIPGCELTVCNILDDSIAWKFVKDRDLSDDGSGYAY